MKHFFFPCILLFLLMLLVSCTPPGQSGTGESIYTSSSDSADGNSSAEEQSMSAYAPVRFTKYDTDATWNANDPCAVFSNDGITVTGNGLQVSGTTLTINTAGNYVLSGACANGAVIVDADLLDRVHIIFNGLNLTNTSGPAVWVKNADKVVFTLADATTNILTDAVTYADTSAEAPTSCLYATCNIAFNGIGTLSVNGRYNNGISTKDDLRIVSGTINVSAVNNALKGNDSVAILDGIITIDSQDDAIKSDKMDDPQKGFIFVKGGSFTIRAADDAFQAFTFIELQGGTFSIQAGGRRINCETSYVSETCTIS